jgi:hypothetical protein
MSAPGNRQFDPVAAASLAAVNATDRSLRSIQQNLNAPELPAQNQAAQAFTQSIQSVAQLSPAQVLASGQAPQLPGMEGNSALPTPQSLGLPSIQQLMPGTGGAGAFPGPGDFVQQPGNTGGGSGGNGGSSSSRRTSSGSNGGRMAGQSR